MQNGCHYMHRIKPMIWLTDHMSVIFVSKPLFWDMKYSMAMAKCVSVMAAILNIKMATHQNTSTH